MTDFYDDLVGAAGPVDGRVSSTGHVWDDYNDGLRLDGSEAGRLQRVDPANQGGAYGQINLDAAVTKISAEVSWLGTSDTSSENGTLVFIYAANDVKQGIPPTQGIFDDSVHVVFGPWATELAFWEGGVRSSTGTHRYDYPRLNVDGTVYSVSLERRGDTIHLKRPDGKAGKVTDSRILSFAGPYLIFQCSDSVSPNLVPRFEWVRASTDALPAYVITPPIAVPPGVELDT